jgi:hypothetical protein
LVGFHLGFLFIGGLVLKIDGLERGGIDVSEVTRIRLFQKNAWIGECGLNQKSGCPNSDGLLGHFTQVNFSGVHP